MVKIEDEDNVRRELVHQRDSKAAMYFMLAGAILLASVAWCFFVSGISVLSLIGFLIAATMYFRAKRIKRKPILTNRHDRIRNGPFGGKW